MKIGPLNEWLLSKNAPQNPDSPIRYTDLQFLSLLNTEQIEFHSQKSFDYFNQFKTSYSDGIKILELLTEITLIQSTQNQIDLESLYQDFHDTSSWLTQLKKKRFPVTSDRDSQLEKKMLGLPWPYGSKLKFERRGDRAGIELKVFITSEADLIKTIAALEQVKSKI